MESREHLNVTAEKRAGQGDWGAFNLPLERVFQAAAGWRERLAGTDRLWLCWNMSPRWCLLQQKLVREVGWTPLVGFDPRTGPPPTAPGAILIDFNAEFGFPVMWMHFALEFVFLYTGRLAFWHSDLLCRLPVMERLARTFETLEDGQTAAIRDTGGRRHLLNLRHHRYYELCGCTTRGASENQFYNGTGWWRRFEDHPKCLTAAERERRKNYNWDHGAGIMYWKRFYHGPVVAVDPAGIWEGHCTEIGNRNYIALPEHTSALRNASQELDLNYSIEAVAERLGLARLVAE